MNQQFRDEKFFRKIEERNNAETKIAKRKTRIRFNRRSDTRNHLKPFIGCDGEGCGIDDIGRQLFMLLRIGDDELYTGEHLSTFQCLDFICDAESHAILVGFSFGYDITMILRDLPPEKRQQLLQPRDYSKNKSPYTYWQNFAIEYLPRNYLRVARTYEVVTGKERETKILPGTTRTIYETFGFFQKSFLASLKSFDIGKEYLEQIEHNKNARSSFDAITDEIRDYCRIECMLLAEMMEKLRENCHAAGIIPRTWNGAGKLAECLHAQHETITRKQIAKKFDIRLLNLAGQAYYGGRFEITRTGKVAGPIYEYDIRSAYPAAMVRLPCLIHGQWRQFKRRPHDLDGLFIARVKFRYSGTVSAGTLGGFPIRHKNGHIFWSLEGSGVYWSCEIQSGNRMGFDTHINGGYEYIRQCDCQPCDWVNVLYEYRRSIGSSGQGYPIKLGINSLYGKLAQRIGNAKYANPIWAGLITAQTRATINDVISLAPGKIVMIATDGIYSTEKLDLKIGDALGEFEKTVFDDGMFIVQPGLYWTESKTKVRGLPLKHFTTASNRQTFEDAWEDYRQLDCAAYSGHGIVSPPVVDVPLTVFTGLKIAQARGKPETAGIWAETVKSISFDWSNKRSRHIWDGEAVLTYPISGHKNLVSFPHNDFVKSGLPYELDMIREELEDQPDMAWFEKDWI